MDTLVMQNYPFTEFLVALCRLHPTAILLLVQTKQLEFSSSISQIQDSHREQKKEKSSERKVIAIMEAACRGVRHATLRSFYIQKNYTFFDIFNERRGFQNFHYFVDIFNSFSIVLRTVVQLGDDIDFPFKKTELPRALTMTCVRPMCVVTQ